LQLGAHVAGEIDVGGLPFQTIGVAVDEIVQFGDDPWLGRMIQAGDIGKIDLAEAVELHQ
jgi:hypothetical protein